MSTMTLVMKGNTQNNVKLVGTRPSLTEPKAGGKPRAGLPLCGPMTSVGFLVHFTMFFLFLALNKRLNIRQIFLKEKLQLLHFYFSIFLIFFNLSSNKFKNQLTLV